MPNHTTKILVSFKLSLGNNNTQKVLRNSLEISTIKESCNLIRQDHFGDITRVFVY